MSGVVNLNVSYTTNPITAQDEITSSNILNQYTNDTNLIIAVYNASPANVASGNVTWTTTDPVTGASTTNTASSGADLATQFANAVTDLQNLSQTGITSTNATTGVTQTWYMTYQMVTTLNTLTQSLSAAGFTASPSAENLNIWQNLTTFGLSTIINNLSTAVANANTLQSMVDIDYVQTGNNVITTQLNNLNSAITLNQSVLNILTQVQNLKNSIGSINKTLSANFSYFYHTFTGDSGILGKDGSYVKSYIAQTSTLFGTPIVPIINANTNALVSGIIPLDYYNSSGQIVSVNTADAANTLRTNYVALQGQISQVIAQLQNSGGDSGTISALQQVYTDMGGGTSPANTVDLDKQITNWLKDNIGNPTSSTSGNYQSDLTNAINAASQVNTNNQNDLQRYTFVFQEFYESASSVLSGINQLIGQIAQNVSRS